MSTTANRCSASLRCIRERYTQRAASSLKTAARSAMRVGSTRLHATRALIALGVEPATASRFWAQTGGVDHAGLAIHSAGAVLVPVNTR